MKLNVRLEDHKGTDDLSPKVKNVNNSRNAPLLNAARLGKVIYFLQNLFKLESFQQQ